MDAAAERYEREERAGIADEDGNAATEAAAPLFENCTDTGNAHRFALQNGERVRYSEAFGWMVNDGRRWAADDTGEVFRLLEQTNRTILEEASIAGTKEERKRLADWAIKSESAARQEAALRLARFQPGIAIRGSDFDADPWLFNIENGTLELQGQPHFREHRRADLITKLAPVRFDPEATCPTFEAFLDRIYDGRRGLIDFMQRCVGYTLAGITTEQVFVYLYGLGANGKTTLLELIRRLLGDYGAQADLGTFLVQDRGAVRSDLARLAGARMVCAAEIAAGRRLDEVLIKQLTGGDTITARHLYQSHFEFKPQFKLWLAGNHRPVIRETTRAIWRRVKLVPHDVAIPPDEQDRDLPSKLEAELSGILNWAIEGCIAWQRDGLGEPEEVKTATADYREEMDVLAPFLEERCIVDPRADVLASDLYRAYRKWCEEAGEKPVSQKVFGEWLTERGHGKDRHSVTGKTVRRGLELKE